MAPKALTTRQVSYLKPLLADLLVAVSGISSQERFQELDPQGYLNVMFLNHGIHDLWLHNVDVDVRAFEGYTQVTGIFAYNNEQQKQAILVEAFVEKETAK